MELHFLMYLFCNGKLKFVIIFCFFGLKSRYYAATANFYLGSSGPDKLTLRQRHTPLPVCEKPTGRPRSQITEVNINTVWSVIEDRHVFVRQLEDALYLSQMTIHQILMQELKMRCVCSIILFFVVMRWVPKTAFTQTAVTWDRVDVQRRVRALSTPLGNMLHDWVLDITDRWHFLPVLAVVYIILGQPLYLYEKLIWKISFF